MDFFFRFITRTVNYLIADFSDEHYPHTGKFEKYEPADVFSRFLFLSLACFTIFCAIPYLVLIGLFFLNNLVFPVGILEAYRTAAFLFFIAGLGGFLGVFTRHAKRLIEMSDEALDEFEPILRRLSLNYLVGMVVGSLALCILKTKTLVALIYNNKFDGVPEPTEYAVFLVALIAGMFSTELLKRADNEVSKKLSVSNKTQASEIEAEPNDRLEDVKPK